MQRATAAELAVWDDPLEQRRFTRWQLQRDGTLLAHSTLRIFGMHCAACAGLVDGALRSVSGVQAVEVSAASERATVAWQPKASSLRAMVLALRAAGYDALPDGAQDERAHRLHALRDMRWRWFVAAFCAMQVMMLATPSYLASGDQLAPDLRQLLN